MCTLTIFVEGNTMMKSLELQYSMIQFLINSNSSILS